VGLRPSKATPRWSPRVRILAATFGLLVFLTGCGAIDSDTAEAPTAATATDSQPTSEDGAAPLVPEERAVLTVPLSLNIVVEAGSVDSELSSARTVDEVETIGAALNSIWAQADLHFSPITVQTIEIPRDVLEGIRFGSTTEFFGQVNQTFFPEHQQAINGFYVPAAFGVNGFTPQGSNLFFVVDDPSVPSSHEVGHILGLHHDLTDPSKLMFSGTSGTGLTELEQTVARYSALGLFPQNGNP